MSEELRPCPFCKTYAGFSDMLPYENHSGYVRCNNCGAQTPFDAWNTRPIEDALRARIAELEEKQRWRVVADGELPEVYEKVIALAKDCMNVDWVLPKELREVGKGAFARLYNVTHWVTLPELPEVRE